MRSIKKRLALWPIVLIVGIAAIAIPVAADVSSSAKAVVNEPQVDLVFQNSDDDNSVAAKTSANSKVAKNHKIAAVDPSRGYWQDYYDRRRQYWEDRMDRRLEEEDMDDDDGDDKEDAKDSKSKKEDKASKDDDDDSADKEDQERDVYEQRREYWRQRVEREW